MTDARQPQPSSAQDMSAFFRELRGSLDAASKAHEAKLDRFFAGLGPTVAIATEHRRSTDWVLIGGSAATSKGTVEV